MTRQEKINRIKAYLVKRRGFCVSNFEQAQNVILERDGNFFFEVAQFGGAAVIKADRAILQWCKEKFGDVAGLEISDGDTLPMLQRKLHEHSEVIMGQDLYFAWLDEGIAVKKPEGVELEMYEKDKLHELYERTDKMFPYALDYDDRPEEFALVARKAEKIIGVATCYKCTIGLDVLADFRGLGLASYLAKEIALEIEKRGDVPVYITWSDNISSMRVALNAGFVPVGSWYCTEYRGS